MTGAGRVPGQDRGATLAELLVSVSLLIVVSAIGSTVLIGAYRATSATTSRVQVSAEAREALQAVSRELRTAVRPSAASTTPFIKAGGTLVQFYANDRPGSGPTEVTYSLGTDGRLTEVRRPATVVSGAYTWPATGGVSRVLLDGLPAGAFLRYYDDKFSPTCPSGCPVPTSGSPALVDAGALKDLRTVEVTLTVSDPSRLRSTPVVLTERIGLTRNTGALPAP